MKNYFKYFILSLFITSLGGCKNDDEITACPDIYIPLIANINYVDGSGKDLIFGDNPLYHSADIKMYKVLANDQTIPLTFSVNKNGKFLAISLEKIEDGTFYIELKSGITDKITYTAKIDESSPCRDYKLLKLEQNDALAQYDSETHVWTLKKSSLSSSSLIVLR